MPVGPAPPRPPLRSGEGEQAGGSLGTWGTFPTCRHQRSSPESSEAKTERPWRTETRHRDGFPVQRWRMRPAPKTTPNAEGRHVGNVPHIKRLFRLAPPLRCGEGAGGVRLSPTPTTRSYPKPPLPTLTPPLKWAKSDPVRPHRAAAGFIVHGMARQLDPIRGAGSTVRSLNRLPYDGLKRVRFDRVGSPNPPRRPVFCASWRDFCVRLDNLRSISSYRLPLNS